MSGIGEASAVIGVVQVGFSLARTLNTYIGDYRDSRDSIVSLASELDATIIQVKELNSLVASSNAASDGSKRLAEKCIKDSDRLVKRIVVLLTKARLPEDPDAIVNISPGDIIPSRLTKAYWPFVKPQVDVVKSELHVMKTDILIARSCIQSQSGSTAADRTAGEESIVALARSRVLARKLLHEAKAEEQRSIVAMQNSGSAPDTTFVQIPAPNGVGNTQGGGAVASPARKPPTSNTTESQTDDVNAIATDDARITKLAQDIQASIQAELLRKDGQRKANETAEDQVKKSAIEAYQKSIGDRLDRLLKNTDATQRLMKDVFGADLDQDKVKEFLVEQQSQQLKEEFGDILSQFGVKPPVLHEGLLGNPVTGHTGPVAPLSRRRWFFKRRSPRYLYGTDTESSRRSSAISRSRAGSDASNDPEDFLHIAVSYDLGEGKHSFQSIDHTILKHKPCGLACDLQTTMRLWQALPESVKQAVSAWVEEAYNVKNSGWNLHSAMPVANKTPTTRKLLQRIIFGASARETNGSILLILGSTERLNRSGSSTASASTRSEPESGPSTVTKGDVRRLETELTAIAAELKLLRATRVDPVVGADVNMAPITFKDAVGRQFSFSWHTCKTWKGMESLIKQAFLHVDVIGQHVQEGHYDLMGPDGTIILPQVWESMIRPDWEVTMHMWPIPERPKKEKKTKKTKVEDEVADDSDAVVRVLPLGFPQHRTELHHIPTDPVEGLARRKPKKQKVPSGFAAWMAGSLPEGKRKSSLISQALPPMEPDWTARPDPTSPEVIVELPAQMQRAALEQRIKEVDREGFGQRHSSRAAKTIIPDNSYPSANDSDAVVGELPAQRQDYMRTEQAVLHDETPLPEDSDAEDAMLDDEALKNKMLVKYAGGVATLDDFEPAAGRPSPDSQHEALNNQPQSQTYTARSISPVSRASRDNIATVEDLQVNDTDDRRDDPAAG